MARFHQVWAITRSKNRTAIERSLENKHMPNVHWIYYDLPHWATFWRQGRRGEHPHYYLWQIGSFLVARRLHRQIHFDLTHHVTFVTYWMPSFVSLLPVPFIWGPVAGAESAPRSFRASLSFRGKSYEALRDLAHKIGELDPFVRLTARRAALALASTRETEHRLLLLGCRNVCVLSQVGLAVEEIGRLGQHSHCCDRKLLRFVSIGDLLPVKGFHLGLLAFAKLQDTFPGTIEYWIIGDGPERRRLKHLVKDLHMENRVTFWGQISRARVLSTLAECDVLVHPSLHDSGGWVCLEAMAAGCPVICLDLGGPSALVSQQTGIKVPAGSPTQAIHDLAKAMAQLLSNPDLRAAMGHEARLRVRDHFNWSTKGANMSAMYHAVVDTPSVQRQSSVISRA
jgi:glycosyltransferase involved in cell wall biosynthesis